MKLLFIRHAESAGDAFATPPRPVSGFLSPHGVAQAGALAKRLSGTRIDRLLCSPYGRCLQTAEAIAAAVPAPIETRAYLREWQPDPALKDLPSTRYEEMIARDADRYVEECWKTELGEGCYDLHARIVPPLLADLAALGFHRRHGGWVADAAAADLVIAVVAHGGSLGVALGAVLGLPPFPIAALSFQTAGVATVAFAVRRGVAYPQLVIDRLG
jgi:broad specificity phosphatase PhoE